MSLEIKTLEIKTMEKYLVQAIEEFDSNPVASKLMRRLATEVPEIFMPVAVRHLTSNVASNAHRLLSILLLRQERLLDHLATPSNNTREEAVTLFRRFLAVDPCFDVKLAHRLPARGFVNHFNAFDGMRSARALDILDETSGGRRLLPIVGHLPDSSDTRISSKATLFVGRRVQNPAWTRKQLLRPDQRIRANAVEALWGVQTPPAVDLLQECAHDENARVAGNSLVGLHIAGKEEVHRAALTMSRKGKPEARSTAAWVMGKMGRPDFLPRLTELVRDEHPAVRSTALRALMDVHRLDQSRPPRVEEKLPPEETVTLGKAETLPDAHLPGLNTTSVVIRR